MKYLLFISIVTMASYCLRMQACQLNQDESILIGEWVMDSIFYQNQMHVSGKTLSEVQKKIILTSRFRFVESYINGCCDRAGRWRIMANKNLLLEFENGDPSFEYSIVEISDSTMILSWLGRETLVMEKFVKY